MYMVATDRCGEDLYDLPCIVGFRLPSSRVMLSTFDRSPNGVKR